MLTFDVVPKVEISQTKFDITAIRYKFVPKRQVAHGIHARAARVRAS
jgi:hypothetical protein